MRAHRRIELVSAGLPDLAAQSRGVDETPDLAVHFDQRVDRIDGGARDVVHHGALVAGQPIQQRALADVRLAHQRDPSRATPARRHLGHRGQRIDHLVQQIGHPAAVHRADRVRLAQPQRPQLRRVGLTAFAVNLVGRQEHWLARPLQQPRRRLVGRRRADRRIDHEDDRVGGAHRHRRLLGHQLLQALCVGLPSAGVLHDEPPPASTARRTTPGRGSPRARPAPPPRGGRGSGSPTSTCRRSAGPRRPPPVAAPRLPRSPRRPLPRRAPNRFRRPRCRRQLIAAPRHVAVTSSSSARSPLPRSCRWCRPPTHRRPPATATPPASNPGDRGA